MFKEEIDFIVQAYVEGQPIACFLIEYYGNEEFEEELNSLADKYLFTKIYNKTKLSEYQKALITVSLTMIALGKYLNGNFYDSVRSTYIKCYSEYNEQTVEKHIRGILDTFRDRCKYWDQESEVAVPLISCVVPYYRLKDLFAISFDIYRKNLLLDPDASSSQIRNKVRQVYQDFARKDLVSKEDMIKGTQYWMSTFTQSIIKTGVYLDDLILITSQCIELIKDHVWGIDEKKAGPYYFKGTEKWKAKYDSDESNKTEKNERTRKAFFSLEANNLLLTTKAVTMPDSYDANDVWLVIGDKKIELTDIDVSDKNTVGEEYIIQEKTINLTTLLVNPFEKFFYKIICQNDEIDFSEERLFRDILFFSLDNGKEIKPGTDYEGEIICVSKEKPAFDGVSLLYEEANFYITQFSVEQSTPVIIDGKAYVFSSNRGLREVSKICDWISFKTVDEEKEIDVYSSFESILFDSSTPFEAIEVLDCGKKNDSFVITLNSLGDSHINSILVRFSGLTNGYHSIEVINKYTKKMLKGLKKMEFILDQAISKNSIKQEGHYLISIVSSLIGKKELLYVNEEDELLLTHLVKNYKYGIFHISPELFAFSKDNDRTWDSFEQRLFYDNIVDHSKKILVRCPKNTRCYFKIGSSYKYLDLNLVEGKKNTYECFLGPLQTHSSLKHIQLLFSNDSLSETMYVDFVPLVDKANILKIYDESTNTHSFIYSFSGPDKVKCVIYERSPNTPSCSFIIGSGEEFHPLELKPFVRYSVALYSRSKGLLAFEKMPFFVDNYSFYNAKDLKGRAYRVKSVDMELLLKDHHGKERQLRTEEKLRNRDYYLYFDDNDRFVPNDPNSYFGKLIDRSPFNRSPSFQKLSIKVLSSQDDRYLWVEVKRYNFKEIGSLKRESIENGEEFVFDPTDPDIYDLLMINVPTSSFIYERPIDAKNGCIEKVLIDLKEN